MLHKKKVAESRILHIHVVTNVTPENQITTFSVLARGSPMIQIFRQNQYESKFNLHYEIDTSK